jgi:hypothetical protein
MGMHKMQQTAAATKQPERPQSWPKGVSGNPSGIRVSHHALNLYREIAAELGGEAALSVIDRTLLLQATRLLVRSARLKDHDAAIRMSSEARRTLEGCAVTLLACLHRRNLSLTSRCGRRRKRVSDELLSWPLMRRASKQRKPRASLLVRFPPFPLVG